MTGAAARPHGLADQLILAVFDVFVFIDWYGTLSTAQFWDSIIHNARHPLSASLRTALDTLFRGRRDDVAAWMRGDLTDTEIITSLQVPLPARYRPDYLARELLRDCRSATIEPDMADVVRQLKRHAFIAVATDNMDCFATASPNALTRDLAVDELLVSSRIGQLKADDPDSFFRPTLDRYGLTPADAILIDDCPTTCQRFRRWGGHAIHYTSTSSLVAALRAHRPDILR